jgi:seryl-tRNA synthetase
MLDIKFIRENKEAVKTNCKERGVECDIDRLLELSEMRKKLLQYVEELNSEKNSLSELMKKADEKERAEIIGLGKKLKEKLEKTGPELKGVEGEYRQILEKIPNVHSEDTPVGPDESGNKVIKKWGEPPVFSFQPKDHMELGESLGLIDVKRATKTSGSRFNYLKNELALLEYAIVQYVFSVLTNELALKGIIGKYNLEASPKPFIPIIPPVLVKTETMQRMARLEPKEERYYIPGDDLYLVGSAEHALGSMHMDETLPEEDFPLRYVGFSTAFRREAGSYGKDVKGIIRVHQFDKLEIESFTLAENSTAEQNFIVAIQEHLMQSLGLPYQIVAICTGDMSAPDFRQIDIETWMPSQNKYRETHTSDLMTDYQTRRLNTKAKRKNGKMELVHTNDATAFAIGRTLIAILENFQQADGSVKIPEVLAKFMPGGIIEIKKKIINNSRQ